MTLPNSLEPTYACASELMETGPVSALLDNRHRHSLSSRIAKRIPQEAVSTGPSSMRDSRISCSASQVLQCGPSSY